MSPLAQQMMELHRNELGKYALHDLVSILPSVQYQRPGAKFWPQGSSFTDHGGLVRFACTEFVRHAVLWSAPFPRPGPNSVAPPRRSLNLGRLKASLDLRVELEEVDEQVIKTDGLEAGIYPLLSPQAGFSRSHAYRVGQAVWMFEHAVQSRARRTPNTFKADAIRATITETLGMTLLQFVTCVQLLLSRSVSSNPTIDSGHLYLTPETIDSFGAVLVGSQPNRASADPLLAKVFDFLAASPSMHAKALAQGNDADVLRRNTLLHQKPILLPFLNNSALGIAPVPSLLAEYLYEPLTDALFAACRARGLTTDFHLLFEEYVGLALQRHSPPMTKWLHENEVLQKDTKVVDWCAQFGDRLVLVEAKRGWFAPSDRHELKSEKWETFARNAFKAVEQAADFVDAVNAGRVPALKPTKKAVVLVVVNGDAKVNPLPRLRDELRARAHHLCPGLHVVLIHLDQFHSLLATWLSRDAAWLADVLLGTKNTGGAVLDDDLVYDNPGPLWREFLGLFPNTDK